MFRIIDLIYGLPDQDMKAWEENLRILTDSVVDGMDLYQLNVFYDSELEKQILAGKMSPAASTSQQAQMYAYAQKFVAKRDFSRLSICHWRRNNRERSLYNTLAKREHHIPVWLRCRRQCRRLFDYASPKSKAVPKYGYGRDKAVHGYDGTDAGAACYQ
jgi:hypothetical protein